MTNRIVVWCYLCLLACGSSLQAEDLKAILARMDAAAPGFTGMSANLKMTTFTKILGEKTDESGTMKMQKTKKETKALVDFSGQDESRVLSFQNKTVKIYYPKLNEYTQIDTGKNGNLLNQFLLLGFGSSGKDLASNYEITADSVEKVGKDNATKLHLVPKAAEVKEKLARVDVWIAENKTYPLQQQFFEPSGNYKLVVYSNVELNPPGQKVELVMPANATKQKR